MAVDLLGSEGRARRARGSRVRRILGLGAAAALVLGVATACDPPVPPDGRDLGVVLDAAPPAVVAKGETVVVAGAVTNHGTVAADAARVVYGATGGFTVDDLVVDAPATCGADAAGRWCDLTDPIEPGAEVAFTATLTAGQVSGSVDHVALVGSAGTEPDPDPSPNAVVVPVDVRPEPAAPAALHIANGTNYLGTGPLLGAAGVAGHPYEGTYLSVNPYCTAKENGDRFQSGYSGSCSGTVNAEYRSGGYTYAIDVPAAIPSAIDVLLYDARYNEDPYSVGNLMEDSPDDERVNDGRDPMTFSLYAADSTPSNDFDNPLVCTATYQWDTPFDHGPFLGSHRWNRLCSITTSMPSGRYLLRVRNSGSIGAPLNDGSNQFGVVAAPSGAADPASALCRAGQAGCAVVRGSGEASIKVAADTYVARVGLGSVGAEQEGRQLNLELYDPGEGGNFIRILRPTGPGTWGAAPFRWTAPGLTGPSSPVTSVDVTQSRFNGRVMSIEVDLTGYDPPPGHDEWFVEYNFGSGLPVTDRTTWNGWIEDHPAP